MCVLPGSEQIVVKYNTLHVLRVCPYGGFSTRRVALINQVFLNHTSDPLLYGNPITPQRLNAIPQDLQNRYQMSASDSRSVFRTADQTVHGQCQKPKDLLHSQMLLYECRL